MKTKEKKAKFTASFNVLKILFICFAFASIFFFTVSAVHAEEASSTNYNLQVMEISTSGGRGGSSNYGLYEDINYFVIGEFFSPNYWIRAGYMYFKPPRAPVMGTPVISSSSITWEFIDKAKDEQGFRLVDTANAVIEEKAEPNISSFTEAGLSSNTAYTRYIYAYNQFGPSVASNSATVYTQAPSPGCLNIYVSTHAASVEACTFPNHSIGLSGYLFARLGDGNSGWQSRDNTWDNDGLSLNTQYTWNVRYRNQEGISTSSLSRSKFTLANVPGAPSVSYASSDAISLNFSSNGNPDYTEYAVVADNNYLQADGTLGSSPSWSTSKSLAHLNVDSSTSHTYAVKARNGDNVETDYSLAVTLSPSGKQEEEKPEEGDLVNIIIDNVIEIINAIKEFLDELRSNPIIQFLNKVFLAPLIALAALINLLAALGLVNLFPFLLYLIQYLTDPFMYLAGKRRKSWGVAYNSLSKMPVDLAIVRLFAAETNKLIETRVTDAKGRFGFIMRKGRFYIKVVKHGMEFPSNRMQGQDDTMYDNLYFGQIITVVKEDISINISVPLDPIEKMEASVDDKAAIKRYLRTKFSFAFAVMGPILGAVSLWISPSIYTLSLLLAHFIILSLFIGFKLGKKIKPWGTVYDTSDKSQLKHAVVRIFNDKYDMLLETRVTDSKGRYGFFVGPEVYHMDVSKDGYAFPSAKKGSKKDYHGQQFSVPKENIVNFDVPMDPIAEKSHQETAPSKAVSENNENLNST